MENDCKYNGCLFGNMKEPEVNAIIDKAVSRSLKKLGLEDSAADDIKDLRILLSDWRTITKGTKETAHIILISVWKGAARLAGLCILAYIAWKMGFKPNDTIKNLIP